MNTPQFTGSPKASSRRRAFQLKRTLGVTGAVVLLLGVIAFWLLPGKTAAHPGSEPLTALLRRASSAVSSSASGLRAKFGFEPVPMLAGSGSSFTISTIVGGGFASNVTAKQAPVVKPIAAARDPLGRGFYFIDETDNATLLRFVNTSTSAVTLAGTTIQPNSVNLIAGGGTQILDGSAARSADLALVTGLAVDTSGDVVYMCIPFYTAIRAINVSTHNFNAFGVNVAPGAIGTIMTDSTLTEFRGVTVHPSSHDLYFIGTGNNGQVVYQVSFTSGTQSIYAGGGNPSDGIGDNGPATSAKVTPSALAFDANNNLFIADVGFRGIINGSNAEIPGSIRKVNTSQIISTVASGLAYPNGVTVAPNGKVYATLGNAGQVVNIVNGNANVVGGPSIPAGCDPSVNPSCGDGGLATNALFTFPSGSDGRSVFFTADSNGLILPDFTTHRVRYINTTGLTATVAGVSIGSQKIDSIVGNGAAIPFDNMGATATELVGPTGVVADAQGNLFISDTGDGNRLRYVNRGTTAITLFANTDWAMTVQPGQIVTLNRNAGSQLEPNDGRISTILLTAPQGLAVTSQGVFMVDSQGGVLFPATLNGKRTGVVRFLNTSSTNATVLGITVPPGMCSIVAGQPQGTPKANIIGMNDGGLATQGIVFPSDVAVDASGNLYITDINNNRIRKVDASTGIFFTIYGDGTTGTLNGPTGVAVDSTGRVYIADTKNNRVLRQNSVGSASFSVLADTTLGINRPRDLVVDSAGQVFVTNAGTHQIIKIVPPATTGLGTASVVAGTGTAGFSGDGASAKLAALNLATPGTGSNDVQLTDNLTILADGSIVFADTKNNRLRQMVSSVNQSPVLTAVSNQTMSEGGNLTLTFTATDAENDHLTLTLTGKPSFGTFTDNGNGTASLQLSPGVNSSGTYNMTVNASDGNTSVNVSFTLTVSHVNHAPVVTANSITSPIEATSSAGALVHLQGSATDADGDTITYKWFDGANQIATTATADVTLSVGSHSIFLMATDTSNANTSTVAQTVVVQDTVAPVITGVPANQTFEGNTVGGRVYTFTNPTATDTVTTNVTVTASGVPANNLFPVGTTTVTFTAKDASNNTATASFTVTVNDTTKPTFSNLPTDKLVEATSSAGATVTYTMPTATDIVDGNVTVTADKPSGSVFPFGDTTVHLTAKDAKNNTATASFIITVLDTTPPVIRNVPANMTVEATSAAGATVNYTMPTATDNVDGNLTVTTNKASGTVFPFGTTIVTFEADDANNNSATASFTVTVVDTTKPVISGVPANIKTDPTSSSGATVTYTMPTAIDNIDGAVAVTTSKASGTVFPLGSTTVTFTAKDARNNTATASFVVTIADTVKPVITGVPANQTFEATVSGGRVFTFTMPTATDNIDGVIPVTVTGVPANNLYPPGTTTVTFTAKDSSDNIATASFTVTVTDNTPPTISNVPANLTVEATSFNGAVVNYGMPTATDPVEGNVTVTADKPSGSVFPFGTTTVTFTAKDSSNNAATATFTVTVVDTTKPVIIGLPVNKTVESSSTGGAVVNYHMPTATDSIDGVVTVTASQASGTLFPFGTTTVTFTAKDSHNNTATATFTVTVTDLTKPVINGLPADITVEATMPSGAVVNYTLPTANDNLDGAISVTASNPPGSVFPLGTTTVIFTATDAHNNASTKSMTVTVTDTTKPVISNVPANIVVQATSGSGTVVNYPMPTANDLVDGPVAIIASKPSNFAFPLGPTTVTFTATDSHGNTATTSFVVNITDSTVPTISNVPTSITVEATSPGGAVVNYTLPTATDTIDGNVAVTANMPPGSVFPLGTNTVLFTAKDPSNNTATATFTVTVIDTTKPVISNLPVNFTAEATSASGAAVNYPMPIATDLVDGNVAVIPDKAPGSVFPLGTTTVNVTAKDAHNNTATASFTITVVDTTKPAITNVPANITAEATSASGATVNYTMPTATDLVDGNRPVTADKLSGTVFPLGTTTVTFTTADTRNNTATASFTVTVVDTTKPVISGVPANITAEATSANGATVTYTMPTASDVVDGAVNVTSSKASGTVFPIGDTTVTFTAKDARNNTATASFVITIVDTTKPVINGVPANITAEATSASGATVTYTMPTATDIVGGTLTVVTSKASGTVFPLGKTTVTFTVTDDAHNVTTASFTVTVVDTTKPVLSGVPANQVFEANTLGGRVFTFTPSATDTVQGTVTVNVAGLPAGNLYPVGTTTVTLSATDQSGNTATASFTVTVTDTQAPVISNRPANINTEAASTAGALVTYTMPTALDIVDGNVIVTADKASGTLFPIGATTVHFTATDAHGNTATDSFVVTVYPEPTYTISTSAGSGNYGSVGNGGAALAASFKQVTALAYDNAGGLLVLDTTSRTVRRIDAQGNISAFAGTTASGNTGDGKAAILATFGAPSGIAVDSNGNVYIADATFNRVRVVTPDGKISHYAGDPNGQSGSFGDGGLASSARLRAPSYLTVDAQGNLFIADTSNQVVRRVDAATKQITTVAGTGLSGYNGDNKVATQALLNYPAGLAVDAQGNLFISDMTNQRIRRVDAVTKQITTVAGAGTAGFSGDDGLATAAMLNNPTGLWVDAQGHLFVADRDNQRVRRISSVTGKIKTVAGLGSVGFSGDGGTAANAALNQVQAVILDANGNGYVADSGNLRVRKLTATNGNQPTNHAPVMTFDLSNQTMTKGASLDLALSATDEDGDSVTFTLLNAPAFATIINANPAQRTATLHLEPGTQTGTFAGVQVQAADGKGGVTLSMAFTITVNDGGSSNHPPVASASALPPVIEATSNAGAVVNLQGSGTDQDNDTLSFTWKDNATVIATTATASVTLGLGSHSLTLTVSDGKGGTNSTTPQVVLVRDTTPPVISGVPANQSLTTTLAAGLVANYTMPTATDLVDGAVTVTADKASGSIFAVGTTTVHFTATDAHGNAVGASFTVTVTLSTGGGGNDDASYLASTFAGSGNYGSGGNGGLATSASFKQLTALTFDNAGSLLVADAISHVVRRIDAQGNISAFAGVFSSGSTGNTGDGKAAVNATFGAPSGIAVDSKGNVYIADATFNRVRVVTPDGKISHYAGDPNGQPGIFGDGSLASSARLRGPTHLAVDAQGNLYIADTGNQVVRRVDAATKQITTVAGTSSIGYNGDNKAALSALLNYPAGLAVDAQGNLFIADSLNHRIRRVDAVTKQITTVAGNGTAGFSGDGGLATDAMLNNPISVWIDAQGNLFVADRDNQRVRRVSGGKITTVAGLGTAGFSGDGGPATQALLSLPTSLVGNSSGAILVGETGSLHVRKLTPSGGQSSNHAPVVAIVANQTVNVGQTINVAITATDQDNDAVTLSLTNAPAFVTLTNVNPAQRTATLRIAPSSANQVGTFTGVIISANDGHGGVSQSNAFSITVVNNTDNHAPSAQALSLPGSINASDSTGATVSLNGTGSSDPDGDTLSFSWTDNGTVIATSAMANVKLAPGTHSIVLTVNDGHGGISATTAQTVTVNAASDLSIASVTPAYGRRGETVNVVINGSGFTSRSAVSLSGAGINVRTTFVSSTKLLVTLTISNNASIVSRSVSVVNPGGASAVLANGFEIRP